MKIDRVRKFWFRARVCRLRVDSILDGFRSIREIVWALDLGNGLL